MWGTYNHIPHRTRGKKEVHETLNKAASTQVITKFNNSSEVFIANKRDQLSLRSWSSGEEMKEKRGLFPVERLLDEAWEWLRWKSAVCSVEQDEVNAEEIGLGKVTGARRKGRDSLQTPGIRLRAP